MIITKEFRLRDLSENKDLRDFGDPEGRMRELVTVVIISFSASVDEFVSPSSHIHDIGSPVRAIAHLAP